MQEYIGCSIQKENSDTYEVTVTSAHGPVYVLTVPKSEVKPMRLPFASEIFPGNAGLLNCEVLQKDDKIAIVSVKAEPVSEATRLEVPLSLLAKRRG